MIHVEEGEIVIRVSLSESPELRQLIKSIPGTKYDGERYVWTVPLIHIQEVARLFPEQLFHSSFERALSDAQEREFARANSNSPMPTLTRRKPRLHQAQAYDFASRLDAAMLNMWMGCLSGDTLINVSYSTSGITMRLDELVSRFNDGRWNSDLIYVRGLLSTGRLGRAKLVAALDNGIKPVVKVTTNTGRTLTCTPDHEIMTPGGKVQAQSLNPGDEVIVQVNHAGRWLDKDGYIRVGPARRQVPEHVLVAQEVLGREFAAEEEVHHLDGVRHNNEPENLVVLSASEHKRLHAEYRRDESTGRFKGGSYTHQPERRYDRPGYIRFPKGVEQILSVEPAGEEHVYDLSVEDEAHTYCANGFVVGNTGKTKVVIDLIQNDITEGKVLILAPRTVVRDEVWPREFAKDATIPYRTLTLLDQTVAKRKKLLEQFWSQPGLRIAITNHEAAWRDPLGKYLEMQPIDWLVVDECLPAGSLIDTPHGQRPIEEIEPGDIVWGWNDGRRVKTTVAHRFERETDEPLFSVNGVAMTGNHPVWTKEKGYVEARKAAGLTVLNGARLERAEVHELPGVDGFRNSGPGSNESRKVYNLETSTGNFFVDGLLVHNCHRAKMPMGKFSRWLAHFAVGKARRRLALTGTPMPHSPLDVFAQFRFLEPTIFGMHYVAFRNRYANVVNVPALPAPIIKGYKNLDELERRMDTITFTAGPEVLDLPEEQHIDIQVHLEPRAMKQYQEMERYFITDVENGVVTAGNALVRLLRLQQLTSGWLRADDSDTPDQVSTAKREVLDDLLEDMPQDEPIVVFCRFHTDLDDVKWVAEEKHRRNYYEVSGRTKGDPIARWRQDENGVLGVQIQAGGVGIDLTKARYCVYYSIGFSLGDYLQSLSRINRPGQERPVTYYHLVAKDTVDEAVYKALSERRDLIEAVLEEVGR